MKKFIELSKKELNNLSIEERIAYQKKAIEYYGNLKEQLKYYKIKGIVHPLLLFAANFFPTKLIKLNELQFPKDGGPVIFSANHSNSNDFPNLMKIIKTHFFILSDFTMLNDPIVNTLNKLNGCIYVDRKSKKSGQNAFKQSVEGINKGYNMVIFPEGTWNLLQSQPILPRKWGDIKIAQETGRPIIPIVMEYNGKNCFAKTGNPIYINKNDNIQKCDEMLYDSMATLKYDIWESEVYKKNYKDISYEEWLKKNISGYKYFDVPYEMGIIRKTDDYHKEEFDKILEIGEQIHPLKTFEKKLIKSKINYRL